MLSPNLLCVLPCPCSLFLCFLSAVFVLDSSLLSVLACSCSCFYLLLGCDSNFTLLFYLPLTSLALPVTCPWPIPGFPLRNPFGGKFPFRSPFRPRALKGRDRTKNGSLHSVCVLCSKLINHRVGLPYQVMPKYPFRITALVYMPDRQGVDLPSSQSEACNLLRSRISARTKSGS